MISTRRDKMSAIKFTDEKILKPRKGIPMLIFLIIAAILSFAMIIVSAALFIDEYNNLALEELTPAHLIAFSNSSDALSKLDAFSKKYAV